MESTSSTPVVIDIQGAVATVTLNRPAKRNALDLTMRRAIADAFLALEREPLVRSIVVTGGPTVFAAGADLNLLVDKGSQEVADLDLLGYWSPVMNSTRVVIAAVSGPALGAGCELAMMCDFIVADASAMFGQPELMVGIMPGAGGTQRLVRAVGKQVAQMMLLTGETIDGNRAWQLGLTADLTSEPAATLPRAQDLAKRASRMPAKAVAATRRVIRHGADLPLDSALLMENREFLLLFDTADKSEGMQAFLEKRRPKFQ